MSLRETKLAAPPADSVAPDKTSRVELPSATLMAAAPATPATPGSAVKEPSLAVPSAAWLPRESTVRLRSAVTLAVEPKLTLASALEIMTAPSTPRTPAMKSVTATPPFLSTPLADSALELSKGLLVSSLAGLNPVTDSGAGAMFSVSGAAVGEASTNKISPLASR